MFAWRKRKKAEQPEAFHVEPMEPRVLLSADALGVDAGVLDQDAGGQPDRGLQDTHDWARSLASHDTTDTAPLSSEAVAVQERVEIVFLDAGVEEGEQLLADLLSRDGASITQVHLLDANSDGVDQIAEVLAGQQGIDAIHIISHGAAGQIQLGSGTLSTGSLDGYAGQLNDWGGALADAGDILIYGCDLAADDQGEALVNAMGILTGADVAASVDQTGHAAQGGDWDLEFATGSIETGVAFSDAVQAQWIHSLSSDTGFKSPTATGDGYSQWDDATHAYLSDDTWASEEANGEQQDWYDFGFSIPVGATILGIEVSIEAQDASGSGNGADIELSWDGGVTYTSSGYGTASFNNGGDTFHIYGGANDDWGRTWSQGELSDANFRLILTKTGGDATQADVDHLQVKVYYSTNTAPTATNLSSTSVYTEGDASVAVADIMVSDADVGDSITATLTLADPSTGLLSANDGAGYTAGTGVWTITDTVAKVNAALANLVFNPNTNNDIDTTISVVIDDGDEDGGGPLTGTIALDVTAVNDAPTINMAAGYGVNEDDNYRLLGGISIGDIDAGGADLQVEVSVLQGTLQIGTTTGLTAIVGNGSAGVTLTGSLSDLNAALATLGYKPGAGYVGGDTLAIKVDDLGNTGPDGAKGANKFVPITINAANDEQVLATNTGTTVAEGSTGTTINNTMLATTDVDNTAAQLSYTITVVPANGTLRLGGTALGLNDTFTQDDIDNSRITYDHDDSETGSDSFGFSVDDGAGAASTGTFVITVSAVNDNDPVADDESLTVAEGGTATESDLDAGATLLAGDSDTDLPNDSLTVNTTPVSGPSHGSLTLNSDGTFSYTHNGSENFTDSFSYELLDADGGVSDTGTVTITITSVNDNTPTLANPIPDQLATEDVAFSFQFAATTFSDADVGDTLTYIAKQADGTPLPAWLSFDPATRTFSGTPLNDDVCALNIKVTATDGVGAVVSNTFALTVGNVNDAPVLGNNRMTLNSGDTVVLAATMLAAGDVDHAAAGLKFYVSNVSGGQFERIGAPGAGISSFTQAEVTAGNVVFVDDGDNIAPTYSVTVDDGSDSDGPKVAKIVFNPPKIVLATVDPTPIPPPKPAPEPTPEPTAEPTPIDPGTGPDPDPEAESEPEPDEEPADEVSEEVADGGDADEPSIGEAGGGSSVGPGIMVGVNSDSGPDGNSMQGLLKSLFVRPAALTAMAMQQSLPGGFEIDSLAREVRTVLASAEFNSSMDRMRDSVSDATVFQQAVVGSSVAVTTGLSVGYVAWLVRGGVLLSTALSSLPAWQFIDPLPVLARARDGEEEADDDSLESIIKEQEARAANQDKGAGDESGSDGAEVRSE